MINKRRATRIAHGNLIQAEEKFIEVEKYMKISVNKGSNGRGKRKGIKKY